MRRRPAASAAACPNISCLGPWCSSSYRVPLFSCRYWLVVIVTRLCRSRGLLWFALRQIRVQAIANLSIALRLLPQSFGVFRSTLEQHLEARLLLQKVPNFARGGAGVKR